MQDATTPTRELAGKLGAITNLTHGFIYFAPEALAAFRSLGLTDDQQYFAGRAAALGAVPAEVVIATFFNFNPEVVRAAIPGAWDVASPLDIQNARMAAAAAVLERCCPDLDPSDVSLATELAARLIDATGMEGTPIAAANRAVAEPDDPLARLWQRITVLREWRGDVHVAALTTAPVTAVEALILHAATEQVPRAALVATRRWPEQAWQRGVDGLVERGFVDADESFTDAGRAFRDGIEARTDAVCARAVEAVGVDDTSRFIDLLRPIRRGLLEGGAFATIGR